MADKRMFSKKITDSDAFIGMPATAQSLYFHLNQSADDDGFNNQIQIAIMKAHASIDDFNELIKKRFIIEFESGVIAIKHWRMHNTLRKDRYTSTAFEEELKQLKTKENQSYTLVEESGCQVVAKRLPQYSIDKYSIDKSSIDNDNDNSAKSEISPDPDFSKIYSDFENELGRPLSVIESDQIIEWQKDHKPEMITEALKRSVLQNVKTFQYIGSILNNWKSNDIKCLNDVLEADQKRERNKKVAGVESKNRALRHFRGEQETNYDDELCEVE